MCIHIHINAPRKQNLQPSFKGRVGSNFDDFLDSYNMIAQARKVRIDLTERVATGGFVLTKWKSSHQDVLDDAEEARGDVDPLGEEAKDLKTFEDIQVFEKSEKVLGVGILL
jgi:hypothetical protein